MKYAELPILDHKHKIIKSLYRSQKWNIMLWRFFHFCVCSEQSVATKNNWVHLHAFHLSRWCVSLITGLITNTFKLYMIKHLLYDQENIAFITEMRELGLNMKLGIQVLFQENVQHYPCVPAEKSVTDISFFTCRGEVSRTEVLHYYFFC